MKLAETGILDEVEEPGRYPFLNCMANRRAGGHGCCGSYADGPLSYPPTVGSRILGADRVFAVLASDQVCRCTFAIGRELCPVSADNTNIVNGIASEM